MSTNGLTVFDRTLQSTHIWLDEIMNEVGPDRQVAWKVLSIVLHKLRDRLPVELAAHLGAELPLLVRGVYYDQYQPAKMPVKCNTLEEFHAEVAEWLGDIRPVDPQVAVHAVLSVLTRHIPEGQIRNVQDSLPKTIRDAWRAISAELAGPDARAERRRRDGELDLPAPPA